jgi:hypothetical protein
MATLSDLPNELVVSIVDLVKEEQLGSVFSILLTSKKFYPLAIQALYRDLCIDGRMDSDSTAAQLQGATKVLSSVQTLTIRRLFGWFEGKENPHVLLKALDKMDRLESFSVKLNMSYGFERKQDHSNYKAIHRVLQKLPLTVTNLEIDAGVEEEKKELHLCHRIGTLLPQLRVLRVALSCVCMDLMHQIQEPPEDARHVFPLRSAVIRLGGSLVRPKSCLIKAFYSELLKPSEFAQELRRLCTEDRFPHLQHLAITSAQNVWPLTDLADANYTCQKIREIKTNSTTSIPVCEFDNPAFGFDLGQVKRAFRDFDGNDLLGTEENLRNYAEGSLGWKTTPDGARMPPKASQTGCYELGSDILLERAPWESTGNMSRILSKVREREEIEGVPLLRASRVEGVHDERPAEDRIPPGWEIFEKLMPKDSNNLSAWRIIWGD